LRYPQKILPPTAPPNVCGPCFRSRPERRKERTQRALFLLFPSSSLLSTTRCGPPFFLSPHQEEARQLTKYTRPNPPFSFSSCNLCSFASRCRAHSPLSAEVEDKKGGPFFLSRTDSSSFTNRERAQRPLFFFLKKKK